MGAIGEPDDVACNDDNGAVVADKMATDVACRGRGWSWALQVTRIATSATSGNMSSVLVKSRR